MVPEEGEARESAPNLDGRRRLFAWLTAGLVALGCFYAIRLFFASDPPSEKPGRDTALSVKVATIGKGDIRIIVNGLGTVTPIATVNVMTQINGQLTQVAYHEGQMVKKGDFLAQIDPRPYEILQAQYEGQLVHDQGLLDQAKIDLARYQTLLKQNSIARQTEEDQVYLVKQYEGSVKTDRALIESEKLNLTYCHIVSPVDGRVGLRLVDPGNYVQTGTSSTLAVVTQLQPITVIFPVPEDELPNLAPQISSGAPLQVEAYDRANATRLATGELFTVDNQVDTTTGMVKLRAKFENAENRLFPNQFVNAHLLLKTLRDVVIIPNAAIQRGAPGAYAYVVGADKKASVHVLTLGTTDGDFTEVKAGIEAGERVVIEGTDRLRDGALVTAVDTAAASLSAPDGGSRPSNPTPK
ncbi:MAG: efflux RND transporter periplasmic adaptor subunit [Methylocystis sp.]